MSNLTVCICEGEITPRIEVMRYPDGQRNIKLDMDYYNDPKQLIDINCSIRNFDELELLLLVVAAFERHDFAINYIYFKYLFGMRSDRSFELGMPNYFRDVVVPILKQLPAQSLSTTILHPHSQLALVPLEYITLIPNSLHDAVFSGKIVLGADKTAAWWLNNWDVDSIGHFHKTRKDRDITVMLDRETMNKIDQHASDIQPIIVADDLCDGGLTFIRIAEYLEKFYPNHPRYLYVTHGLFTKGIDHVADHYHQVITTNSYQNFAAHPKLKVIDVWKE